MKKRQKLSLSRETIALLTSATQRKVAGGEDCTCSCTCCVTQCGTCATDCGSCGVSCDSCGCYQGTDRLSDCVCI